MTPEEDGVLTGPELAELADGELDQKLEKAAVIARATPLDKLRIIESLRRRGHVVAMTGDGVNDAPSLRLADVGVAMGRTGTEVARQAAPESDREIRGPISRTNGFVRGDRPRDYSWRQ